MRNKNKGKKNMTEIKAENKNPKCNERIKEKRKSTQTPDINDV